MERKLGTFMFYIRLLELLAWLAIVVENGWLTDYIIQRRLGFANNMAAVECIAGFGAFYTLLQIVILHYHHKSSRPVYLIVFIICDIHFIGAAIGTMSILSVNGVPNNCHGLTRQNYNPGDAPNNPAPGYATIRFGSGPGDRGELDKYCNLPRAAFGLCIFEIYSYMTSIILAILRIRTIKHPHRPLDPESKPTLSPKPSCTSLDILPAPPQPAALPHPAHVRTARHELPTRHSTTELASPGSELGPPVAFGLGNGIGGDDGMAGVEPSISNGAGGSRRAGSERSVSVRSGPPPAYMPASERVMSGFWGAAEKKA